MLDLIREARDERLAAERGPAAPVVVDAAPARGRFGVDYARFADIGLGDDLYGSNSEMSLCEALDHAAALGDEEMVRRFVDNGLDVDPDGSDSEMSFCEALDRATALGDEEMVRRLLA